MKTVHLITLIAVFALVSTVTAQQSILIAEHTQGVGGKISLKENKDSFEIDISELKGISIGQDTFMVMGIMGSGEEIFLGYHTFKKHDVAYSYLMFKDQGQDSPSIIKTLGELLNHLPRNVQLVDDNGQIMSAYLLKVMKSKHSKILFYKQVGDDQSKQGSIDSRQIE
jgi:hypothetical protein